MTKEQNLSSLFGSRVRILRASNKLTQKKMASALGITRQHLCRIERGFSCPSFDTLQKICDILEIDPATLFIFHNSRQASKNGGDLDAVDFKKNSTLNSEPVSVVGTWIVDFKNETIKWSDSLYQILGYSYRPEPKLDLFLKRIGADKRNIFKRFYQKILAGIKVSAVRIEIERTTGRRTLRIDSDFIKDGNKISRAIITVTDMTGQENTFRKMELYMKAFESSLAASAILDSSARFINVNFAFVWLWNKIIGNKKIYDSYIDDFLSTLNKKEKIKKTLFDLKPWQGTLKFKDQEGQTIYIKFIANPITDNGGQFSGINISAWDETSKIIAAEKLRKNEAVYRGLFNAAAEGLMVGDQNNNILDANDSALKLFGYTRERITALKAKDIIDKNDLRKNRLKYDRVLKGEKIRTRRKMIRRDGSIFIADIKARNFADNKVIVCIHGITEKKSVEPEMNKIEEQHSADKRLPIE
mgnify:CR=1 FL=1